MYHLYGVQDPIQDSLVFLPEREYAQSGNEEGDHVNEQNSSGQLGELQIVQQLSHLIHTNTHIIIYISNSHTRDNQTMHCHDFVYTHDIKNQNILTTKFLNLIHNTSNHVTQLCVLSVCVLCTTDCCVLCVVCVCVYTGMSMHVCWCVASRVIWHIPPSDTWADHDRI